MSSSQTTLDSKPEFCEYSEAMQENFRCKLSDFGFCWRCTLEDRSRCPDLEYFKEQERKKQ